MMIWKVNKRSPAGQGSNCKDEPNNVVHVIFIMRTHHDFWQFDVTLKRFYNIRVVLLVCAHTTANGHNQPGFKVFHLVWFELYFDWLLPSDL